MPTLRTKADRDSSVADKTSCKWNASLDGAVVVVAAFVWIFSQAQIKMSRKSLSTLATAGPSRSPSKRSSIGSIDANAPTPSVSIHPQRERALIDACTRGDATAVSAALAQIQDQQATGQRRLISRELEELVGYAFACAAGGSHVHVLELLFLSSGPVIRQTLMHGICREARFFASRSFFHCCFALRYAAFAAVVSIEQRALASLEWLTARHPLEGEEGQDEDLESEDEGNCS